MYDVIIIEYHVLTGCGLVRGPHTFGHIKYVFKLT